MLEKLSFIDTAGNEWTKLDGTVTNLEFNIVKEVSIVSRKVGLLIGITTLTHGTAANSQFRWTNGGLKSVRIGKCQNPIFAQRCFGNHCDTNHGIGDFYWHMAYT